MAITERYVTTTGAGAHDGTTEGNAFTWAEMVTDINTPRVGYRYNVKAGTYSLSASDTITADGTAASGNCIRGYNSTIGDLDDQGRTSNFGALDTTNFPTLAYGSTFRFVASGADFLHLQNFIVTGDVSAALVHLTTSGTLTQVKSTNSSTNSAGTAITVGVCGVVNRCDADCTGASGPTACILTGGADALFNDCRVVDCPNAAIATSAASTTISNCVFGKDVDGAAISYTSGTTSAAPPKIVNCTSFSAGASFYSGPNTALTKPVSIINCHVTDTTGYLATSGYVGTGDLPIYMAHNRTRDLSSGVVNGFADWATITTVGHVTTDGGDNTTDYTDGANNDLSLITTAPGRGVGTLGNDIGAITKQAAGGGGLFSGNLRGNTQ
jgi:hypothetical protein